MEGDAVLTTVSTQADPFAKPLVPPSEHPLVWDLAAVLKGQPSDVSAAHACMAMAGTAMQSAIACRVCDHRRLHACRS